MDENLVGYLLNALDDDTHQQVEAYLRQTPAAQRRLEALRQVLEPLAADREEIEPPAGLAFRALTRVAEYRCRPVPEPPVEAPATVPGNEGTRRSWRRPDAIVAAGIVLVAGALVFQGVGSVRATSARLACAENLSNFHEALTTYSVANNGHFPGVPVYQDGALHGMAPVENPEIPVQPAIQPRRDFAGVFVIQLRDGGYMGAKGANLTVRCPANGEKRFPRESLDELDAMSPDDFDKTVARLASCYAYSLGYRDPAGEHCGLCRDPDDLNLNIDLLPIMADRPSVLPGGGRGNTPNHKGGQNVLYVGGNVRFCSTPNAGIDGGDIYTNKEGKVAPGVNRLDTVLGLSGDPAAKK